MEGRFFGGGDAANGARTESVALGPRERGPVRTAPPLMSNRGEPFDPGIRNPVEGAVLNSVAKKDTYSAVDVRESRRLVLVCLFVCPLYIFF